MQKQTIKMDEYGHIAFPKNYGTMHVPSESHIWKTMSEKIPENHRYLKHFVEKKWTEDPDRPSYKPEGTTLDIPVGDLDFYLIIYSEPNYENRI